MSEALSPAGNPTAAPAAATGAPGAGGAPSPTAAPNGSGAPPAAPANGAAPAWYQGLGPAAETAQLFQTKGWKNIDEVSKAYHDLEKVVGAKGVIVPGEKAGDDEWGKFYDGLGRPKTGDEYKIPLPGDDYTQTEQDKAYEKAMRPAFHKAGLTQRQIDIIAGAHNGAFAEVRKSVEAAQADAVKAGEAEIETLKAQWGPKANANIALAQQAAQSIIPKDSDLWARVEKHIGAGAMVDLMYRVGTQFSESGGALKAGGGAGAALTKEQAQAEIDKFNQEISLDPKHPYRDASNPAHAASHERMFRLMQIVHPGNIG